MTKTEKIFLMLLIINTGLFSGTQGNLLFISFTAALISGLVFVFSDKPNNE